MSDDQFNSILDKYRAAAALRDQEAKKAADLAQQEADKEAQSRAIWSGVEKDIRAEVARVNAHLEDLGYKLYVSKRDRAGSIVGSVAIAFEPLTVTEFKLEMLTFSGFKNAAFNSSFGAAGKSNAARDQGPLHELDSKRIRKTLHEFLDLNAPG